MSMVDCFDIKISSTLQEGISWFTPSRVQAQDISEYLTVPDDVPFDHTIVNSAAQHLNTKQNPTGKCFSDKVCIVHPRDQL